MDELFDMDQPRMAIVPPDPETFLRDRVANAHVARVRRWLAVVVLGLAAVSSVVVGGALRVSTTTIATQHNR